MAMFWNDKRVLITGGAGFIGSHLVDQLVVWHADVTVVDNLSRGRVENLAAVLDRIKLKTKSVGEVLESGELSLQGFDTVFHLAANAYVPPSVEDPEFDYRTNLETTFLLIEKLRACPKPPRLVYASSAGVYGDPVRLPIRETDLAVPISPYGVSKLAAERYVSVYSRLYGIRATSLRFFSVFGPLQRKQIIFDFFSKLRKDPTVLTVIGDGSQERDLVYVDDVVQALCLAATVAPGRGEVYNVASGRAYSTAELARAVCRAAGTDTRIEFTGQVRPGDAQRWLADISLLEGLGFAPKYELERGLQAVREWFDRLAGK